MSNPNRDISIDVNQVVLYKYDAKLQADRVSIVDADVGFDLSLDAKEDSVATYSQQEGPHQVGFAVGDKIASENGILDCSAFSRLALYGKPSWSVVKASPLAEGDVWFEIKASDGNVVVVPLLAKRVKFECPTGVTSSYSFYVLLGS